MKKMADFLLTGLYVLILMIISLFLFWEAYAKEYIEEHIKSEYGHDIKETKNNSTLVLEMLKDES